MYQIDVMSRVPVYEQIVEQTKNFILKGVLNVGDQIPTVRQLALDLSVNPNTIAKAVKELDRQRLVVSSPGRGCFVTEEALRLLQQERRKELPAFREYVRDFALGGVSKDELHQLIDEVYAAQKTETVSSKVGEQK